MNLIRGKNFCEIALIWRHDKLMKFKLKNSNS